MNISSINHKYRKYVHYAKQDPNNQIYQYKLNKYRTLLGGENANANTNANANANTNVNTNANSINDLMKLYNAADPKTAEVIRKIQNILAYSKQQGITGGAHGKKMEINKVSGTRKMSGAVRHSKK